MTLPEGVVRVEELRGDGDARVVDQDLDRAEALRDAPHGVVDLGPLADVAGHGERLPAERPDLRGDGVQLRARARGDGDVGAFAGERERDRPPDAPAAAGDEGDPVR